jgi:hypothetical protein
VSDLKDKIQAIIYPNEKGLVWTREEQVNLLLTLFEEQCKEEIRDELERFIECVMEQTQMRNSSYISGRRRL